MKFVLTLLLSCAWCVSTHAAPGVTFTIDAKKDVHPISPYIYGINQKIEAPFSNIPFVRVGGNRWTCYNWTNNASNAGSDWHFQNDNFLGGGDAPGGALIGALDNAAQQKSAILITVPTIGHVSADKKADGDVQKTPNHLKIRFHESRAKKDGKFTLTPDPNSPVVYQDEFVNWVKTKYPNLEVFFSLDNEPDLWASTHKQVHPDDPTYAEIVRNTIDYAKAIKTVAPKTQIFAPANYGWQGFVRLQKASDANNRDFHEVFLAELAAVEKAGNQRLLDVLDVHWYPEARSKDNVRITENNITPSVIAARLQAPRSLWDPTYTEASWIAKDVLHEPIKLIPRLFDKINRNYPGTRLAITEYNYGGADHISGAIAQADVLGIFGREGIYAANQWPLTGKQKFVASAFAMYRNFDGQGATFGDTSIHAATDNIEDTSIYASLDSKNPGRMVLVALNKTNHSIDATIRLENAPQFVAVNVFHLTEGAKIAPKVGTKDAKTVTCDLPPYSVTSLHLTGEK